MFGLVIGASVLPDVVVNRILFTFKPEAGQVQARIGRVVFDPSTSQRIQSSEQAIDAWTTRPILGFGVTGYRFLDAQYARTLVETGALGFAAFAYLLWSVARVSDQSYRRVREPTLKGLALGFLAGYVGLLFHGIGANTFILVRVMEPFWFFTAVLIVLPRFDDPSLSKPPADFREIHAGRMRYR